MRHNDELGPHKFLRLLSFRDPLSSSVTEGLAFIIGKLAFLLSEPNAGKSSSSRYSCGKARRPDRGPEPNTAMHIDR